MFWYLAYRVNALKIVLGAAFPYVSIRMIYEGLCRSMTRGQRRVFQAAV